MLGCGVHPSQGLDIKFDESGAGGGVCAYIKSSNDIPIVKHTKSSQEGKITLMRHELQILSTHHLVYIAL